MRATNPLFRSRANVAAFTGRLTTCWKIPFRCSRRRRPESFLSPNKLIFPRYDFRPSGAFEVCAYVGTHTEYEKNYLKKARSSLSLHARDDIVLVKVIESEEMHSVKMATILDRIKDRV